MSLSHKLYPEAMMSIWSLWAAHTIVVVKVRSHYIDRRKEPQFLYCVRVSRMELDEAWNYSISG